MKQALHVSAFAIAIALAACNRSNLTGPSPTKSLASVSVRMSMTNAPTDVATIVGVLSQGSDTLKSNFIIANDSSASCLFSSVPVGTWHLQVNAYDASNVLKYTGGTDVQVLGGEVTPVTLVLNPASGSISVVVKWGSANPDSSMALQFDGSTGEVVFPASPLLQVQKFTIQFKAYFYPTSQVIVPLLDPSNANLWNTADGCQIRYELNGFGFSVAQQYNVSAGLQDTAALPLNTWTNISCTYDGSALSIYINGRLEKSKAYSSPIYYGSHGFTLGEAFHSYYSLSPFWFHGGLDNLQIWNYAMTQSQIDSTMNKQLVGNEPGLVGYWDFNQKSSDRIAIDRTGNGNNGTLEGGVQFVPASSL